MNYIFKDGNPVGVNPIDYFQMCWYDMNEGGRCFDESFIETCYFNSEIIASLDCEDNVHDSDRTRLFMKSKNGDFYEISLHKLTREQWDECSNFYGGRSK